MNPILLISLACIFAISGVKGFKLSARPRGLSVVTLRMAADTEESEEEMIERLRKKARKMMYNENGVAYAPWVSKQIDEEAIIKDLIRKERGQDFKPAKTSILDRGEIEAAEGMRWRMSGSQVDLAWGTGGETNNQGFIVEKRPSYVVPSPFCHLVPASLYRMDLPLILLSVIFPIGHPFVGMVVTSKKLHPSVKWHS